MTRSIRNGRESGSQIKVLLADGRKIVHEGLRLMLERHSDITIIGEADGPAPAIKLARALAADVAILNVSLATPGVAQTVRELSRTGDTEPHTSVLVMSMTADGAFVRDVLRAGGRGILTKECAVDELVTAIRAAARGDVYLSPRLAHLLVADDAVPRSARRRTLALSSREREILERIANGDTTKAIAHDLRVSTKTVETYRCRVMEKLGLHSVAELTKYAIQMGLTSLELTRQRPDERDPCPAKAAVLLGRSTRHDWTTD
jgi:DNA-binding NarL/FixJ family response regulator